METNKKGQLYAELFPQAQSESEKELINSFLDRITEGQATQILELYDFTEQIKIPIWENDRKDVARDAGREHDTPPDRYIEGYTAPRNVAEDLAIIIFSEGSMEGVQQQIELTSQLTHINKEYWRRLGEILGKPSRQLPSVTGKRINKLDFPVDKVNSKVWKLLESAQNGQIGIAVEKHASKKQLTTLYSINFDALGNNVTISRKLEPFDKRVYLAVSALHNAGNSVISLTQIYRAMGYTTTPNEKVIEKIENSISKMAAAHLSLDNSQEARAYKYDKFVYSASLLPMERVDGVINGKVVESAIHLFREPPLISFARGREQITTIERRLLETPVNKTDQTLMIEDYLIERIAHAKTGNLSNKILYDTLFKEAKVTDKKQRLRAKAKVKTILWHYVKCDYIKNYEEEEDGITICF